MNAPGTILNVNDHEQTRYLVTRLLKMAGYGVIEAASGEEALRSLEKQPDLVILDVKLPDLSGLDVCRMIKGNPRTASTFVLQTSATFISAERKVQGLESGADGYLAHPFEPAELIATVKSLLRLKSAEEVLRARATELVVADKRKDEFLAMLAHELRNPLAAITGAVNMLEVARTDEAMFLRLRDILQRQGRHLARLIDDLLDVSRMTRNRIELKKERCDLGVLVNDAIRSRAAIFEARDLRVVDELEVPLWIDADCTRVNQVITNLIDNACKYSSNGGTIRVTLRRADRGRPGALLRVEDEGIGIAPAFLPRVFELFAQADESLERARGGLGIGLTITKSIAELHGGSVTAHSDGVGRGAAFEVWLPARPAGEQQPKPTPVPAVRHRPRRVLVVEDNVDAADMLEEYLRFLGHDVFVVHDGKSGVEAAKSGRHDIAFVDIGLPELDGYQVAREVRRGSAGAKRPSLVALTGYGAPEQKDRAMEAGFDKHVLKPVDPDTLVRLLDELGGGQPVKVEN